MSATLGDLLSCAAEEAPERVAFRLLRDGEDDVLSVTYRELHERACGVARVLGARSASERVLLLYPPGIDFLAAMFGALYAGHVAVPAHPPGVERGARRLEAIAQDSDAAFVLTTAEIAARGRTAGDLDRARWIATDEIGAESDCTRVARAGDDLAVLQYTSGSTGRPKGVMCTHTNALHNAAYVRQAYSVTDETVSVTWLPHFHDMGLMLGLVQPLFSRVPGVLMPPSAFVQSPLRLLAAIDRYRGSFAGGPNFCFDLCLRRVTPEQRDALDLSSWVCAYNGAEPVRRDTLDRFSAYFAPSGFRSRAFFPALGMAEATAHVCGGSVSEEPLSLDLRPDKLVQGIAEDAMPGEAVRTLVSCGRVAAGMTIAVVDPQTGLRCPDRRVGELWVKGPSVACGYFRREEDTERTFRAHIGSDGPYLRTGDLGFLDRGEVYVAGRLKDVIIVRGANYYPQDIEATVERSHPALRPSYCAAFGSDLGAGEQVSVLVEANRERLDPTEQEAIFEAIRQSVASEHGIELFSVAILARGTILKTSSGKIERRASRAAFESGSLRPLAQRRAPTPREGSVRAVDVEAWLVGQIASKIGADPAQIDREKPFAAFGLASIAAIELSGELSARLGRPLSPTLLYDRPTIDAVVRYLSGQQTERAAPAPSLGEPIAIIGSGCRFPGGVIDLASLWSMLEAGGDAIGKLPPSRRSDADPDRLGGFLPDVDHFDPTFFELSPREALLMDPQQRLLLEVTHEALEDAGLPPAALEGTATGVFVGLCNGDYAQILRSQPIEQSDLHTATGTSFAVASGRISYTFGFEGPSVSIDTACSGSLVAVHLACESLRAGTSAVAVAGGVNAILTPHVSLAFERAGMLAPDGRCKAFDASADGYVRSEGCGIVVLKRLSEAICDGDRVIGVIRGSAVNQDGRSNGLTAPSGRAQEDVLRRALAAAAVAPSDVGYVEAHGTGTPIGDPIELGAIRAVYGSGAGACFVRSVKTNLGHLESAAGIAGLLAAIAAIEHGAVPRQLHFRALNPRSEIHGTRIQIPTATEKWPGKKIAAISSFGLSGTNAHVVIEEPPPECAAALAALPRVKVLPISARDSSSMREVSQRLAERLAARKGDEDFLRDVLFTASNRRTHHRFRACAVGESSEELIASLRAIGERGVEELVSAHRRRVVFVCSGQGSQWVGMGLGLLAEGGAFARRLREVDEVTRRLAGLSVIEVLSASREDERLRRVDVIQPLLFALQVALAEQWIAWGVRPDAVVGHSMGEVAAAVTAGALTLEDGVHIIVARSRAVLAVAGRGRMALIELSAADAERTIAYRRGISIASHHGPETVLVAGDTSAVEGLVSDLSERGVFARLVDVDYASHSHQVDELLEPLERSLSGIRARDVDGIVLCSTLLGEPVRGRELDARYWARNLREPVQFHRAIERLVELGHSVFIEISPHPVLTPTLERSLGSRGVSVASNHRDRDDMAELVEAVGRVYTFGVEVDWSKVYPEGRPVRLPAHPWRHQRLWIEPASRPASPSGHAWLERKEPLAIEPGTQIWYGRLDPAQTPILAEHRVDGTPAVPGALWVDAALHVARTRGRHGLAEVSFIELLKLGDGGADVQIVDRADGFVVLASTDGVAWSRYAEGRWLDALEPSKAPERELAGRAVEAKELYARTSAWGIEYGPHFSALSEARAGEGLAEALLSWEPSAGWVIEPWLLDASLHALALAPSKRPLIPAGIGRFSLHRRPRGPVRVDVSWERGEEVVKGQIVARDDGGVCFELDGVRLVARTLPRSSPEVLDVIWSLAPEPAPRASPRRRWWVIGRGALAESLGDRLRARVVAEARELGAIEPDASVVLVAGEPRAAVVAEVERLVSEAQMVVRALAAKEGPRLCFVTRGARAIGASSVVVEQAPLWGFARTVLQEHPELEPRCVDLPERPSAALLERLVAELESGDREDQVALRPEGRWIARLSPRSLAQEAGSRLDQGATALVTGGMGAIGIALAELLVESGAKRLVLAGRRAPGGAALERIDEIRRRGVDVRIARCDVSSEREVVELVASIGPSLRVVVHAAGVLQDATILRAEAASTREVLAPKVAGAWHLHQATRHLALDQLVMISSAAGVLGSAGQGAYAAANAFLDALAHARRAEGLPALSVAFGTFEDVGLAAASSDRGERMALAGYLGLSSAEGMAVLSRLLAAGATDALVLRLDRPAWTASHPGLVERPFYKPFVALASNGARGKLLREVGAFEPHQRLERLADALCTELAAALRHERASIRPWSAIGELGIDSVTALEVRNRLEIELDLRLPASLLWAHRTIEALALHIAGLLGWAPAERAPPPSETSEPYTDLTDDEATSLLLDTLDALDRR